MMYLTLRWLPDTFAVCRRAAKAPVPDTLLTLPFVSITRTADELSLVLPETAVPTGAEDWRVEPGWCAFVVAGPLDFGLTGVLASLAAPLAAAHVPIFALSTFDTDYLLVKAEHRATVQEVLTGAGHYWAV